jgi:hypothetical protein
MNPLTSIPLEVRVILYWAGYLCGVVSSGITAIWAAVAAASPTVTMPLWLVIAQAVVLLATTQLHLLAGANASEPFDPGADERYVPEHRMG